MGVFDNGNKIYSPKYLTAEITDSEDRIHFVQIKHTIGDYFVTELDGQIYAFSLKGARILTYRQTLTKSFRVVQYDTSHFSALKPEVKELEHVLIKNSLPKMDMMMYNVLRILGRREKAKFENHKITDLVQQFSEKEGQYPEEVRNIKNYLESLDIDEIVTPVRKVTDFIQTDLLTTSPGFLGEMIPRYQRLDNEHKKITNTPIKGTSSILKVALIALVAIIGVAGVFIAYEQGVFDGITGFTDSLGTLGEGLGGIPSPGQFQIPTTSGGIDYSDDAIMANYSPEKLRIAIDQGEIEYDKLSSSMKSMVDSVELPKANPIP